MTFLNISQKRHKNYITGDITMIQAMTLLMTLPMTLLMTLPMTLAGGAILGGAMILPAYSPTSSSAYIPSSPIVFS